MNKSLPLLVLTLLFLGHSASAASTKSSAPPDFLDDFPLPNGCFVSTFIYLEKFRITAPTERGEPLVVVLRYPNRRDQPHTLALVSWRGTWWLRDGHFGVYPLGASTALAPNSPALRVLATTATEAHSLRQVQGGRRRPSEAAHLTFQQRLLHIVNAAHLIGARAELFLVQAGARCMPLLFFRPSVGEIAVYDPTKGTATGRCDNPNSAAIVRTVAMRLGYATRSVCRLDFNKQHTLTRPTSTARLVARKIRLSFVGETVKFAVVCGGEFDERIRYRRKRTAQSE